MRGPTPKQILDTPPPELRMGSRVTQAILDLRQKILTGEYQADQILTMKSVKDAYKLNNIETQTALLRLAIEGLVKIQPVRKRAWPNNAALNEYRVADLNIRHRLLSTRQGDFVSDISQRGYPASKETLELEVQYADEEIALLLNVSPGEPVIFHRNLQHRDSETIVAICDSYIPFWFAPMMPEMRKLDYDVYQLMRSIGKDPFWCKETVDMVQASSVERVLFGLSPDDPSSLFKILRRSFDKTGEPLEVQFLTDRGDTYRLHYSFPLFADGIPEAVRDK
jgi:DNA-binding GntR family transcriptional regulator